MRGGNGARRSVAVLLVVSLCLSLIASSTSVPTARASGSSSVVPESWGGVAPSSDSSKTSVWGSPAMGNVAMSSLLATNPSGGGATSSTVDSNGAFGKLRWLRAFGGATPRFFAEGGTASHMLVAARTSSGVDEVWAWGANTKGQLGIGSTTSFATPVKVAWTPTVAGEQIVHLAVGLYHSLMVTRVGGVDRLYAWGLNTYGQLGDGTFTQRTTPVFVPVSGSPTFASIAAGSYHSVAADSTGAVWVWGCDGGQTATSLTCGDLGLHGTRYVSTPTKLTDQSVNQSTVNVTRKAYSDTTNIATYTIDYPGGFAVGDPLAISLSDGVLDTSFQQVSEYEQTGFSVTLRFTSAHGRRVGDKIYVRGASAVHTTATSLVTVDATPDATTLEFTTGTSRSVSATQTTDAYVHDAVVKTASSNKIPSSFTAYVTQARSSTTTGVITPQIASAAVTHRGLSTTTTEQLWFSGPHSFVVGNGITVTGVNDPGDASQPWDGSFTISSVSNTAGAYWVKYAVSAQPAVISQEISPDGGTVSLAVQSPTPLSVSYTSTSNLVTVTTQENHGLKTGNVVAIDLDDDRYDMTTVSLNSTSTTSFTYRLNSAIATANTTGTATVIGCFENCPTAPTGVLEVAAGEGFTMARTATDVITWGTGYTNHYGRLGRTNPTSTPSTRFGAPITVDSAVACTPREIAAGPATALVSCDTADQDTLVSWGHAYFGRTGSGVNSVTTTSLAQATPIEVKACLSCANNGNTSPLGTAGTSGYSQTGYVTFGRALAAGENIVSIRQSAGGGYALTDSGRMFAWGDNIGRALGTVRNYAASDGATGTKEQYSKAALFATRVAPVDANGASTSIVSLTATGKCGIALDDENVVWSWGDCGPSYLSGRGTTGRLYASNVYGLKFDRIDVPSTARVMFVRSTYRYTYVTVASGDAREDVSVWAFGNTNTQVSNITNYPGDGTTSSYLLPAKVDLPYGFDTADSSRSLATMSCGDMHCLTTTTDGRVYGWGDVRFGSATSTYTKAVLPSQSSSVAAYTYHFDITSELLSAMGVGSLVNPRVAAGTYFSLVVDIGANSTGGRVYGWGRNTGKQASTGTTTTTFISPTAVTDGSGTVIPDVVAVSAGASHSAAIRADGSVITWGSDLYGQLGNGSTSTDVFATPSMPAGRVAVQVIAAGGYTLVRLDDGSVVGFGLNRRGVLGNGNTTNQTSPATVLGGRTFVDLDSSGNLRNAATPSAVAVTDTGEVYGWGANDYGQLGRGQSASSSSFSTVPVRVLRSTGDGVSGVDAVASGSTWNAAYGRFEPLAVPEPPTSVSVTAGDAEATLSWTAPSPFREVSGYEISVSDGSTTTQVAAGSGVTSKVVSGLTNGTQYSFTIRSVNRVGESTATVAVTATPSTRPQPPASLDAVPSAGAITLSWTEPTDDGGSAILDYTARVFTSGDDPAVDTPVATSTVSSRTVAFTTSDGLVNGSAYDVYVSARNANGSSATEASVSAVVPGRPSRPLAVTAAGLPASARVTWQAPASDGGAAIVAYVVSAYSVPGGSLVDRVVVDSSTFQSEGLSLVDGTTYDVAVAASQGGSSSDVPGAVANMGSESARITVVAGRPISPNSPTITPQNGSLNVTWNPVDDVPGITVTHYKVRAVAGSTVTSSALSTTDATCATTCSYTLTSLTNGTTYAVAVVAGVGATDSDFGLYGVSTNGTPRTTPGTPIDLSVETGDESLGLSWGPPVSDGGSPVTGYTVTVTGGVSPIVSTVGATTASMSVGDLVNGTTYTVSVVATNVAGDSATAASASQKAYTVPSAPTVTEIGPTSTTLSTTKKASDGATATLTFASATNLLAGNIVDITGLGTTFDGTDIEITEVTTSSPFTVSYAAQNDTVVAEVAAGGTVRLAGIYLEWDEPDNGGDAITAYTIAVTDGDNAATYVVASGSVKLSNDDPATGATVGSCPFVARTCTISKIESLDENDSAVNILFSNGNTYVVSVSATNAAGPGPSDAPSIVVGQPNEPTALELTASEERFVVCWADPTLIPSGRAIQSYRISAVRGETTRTKTLSIAEVSASSACSSPKIGVEVDEFDDGTSPSRGVSYVVSVSTSVSAAESVQTFGAVSSSSQVVPLGIPDAPTLTGVVVSETSATISWSAPVNTGGQSVTSYEVTSSPSGFGCTTAQLVCTVSGLTRGVSYVFSVIARNASGPSSSVSSQSFTVTQTTTTTAAPVVTTPATTTSTTTIAPPVVATRVAAWAQTSLRGAIGGKILVSSTAKSSTTYTVKGRTVTLWFRAGPSGGKAVVKVNGKTRKTVDLYWKKSRSVRVTVTAPSKKSKSSKVSVIVSTSKNRKSKGRAVVLDAISSKTTCKAGCVKNPAPPRS